MRLFERLLRWALAAGGAAGLLLALLHQQFAVPLILAAESFETPGSVPENPWSRIASTSLADGLAGIGFALLLGAVWLWRGKPVDLRRGLLWGLAGFYVLGLAPALGLPAELPGTGGAALASREAWWVATVGCSALGLAGLVFLQGAWRKLPGLALLVLPHLAGAPVALHAESLAPLAMTNHFQWVSLATQGAFWLVLGALGGSLFTPLVESRP